MDTCSLVFLLLFPIFVLLLLHAFLEGFQTFEVMARFNIARDHLLPVVQKFLLELYGFALKQPLETLGKGLLALELVLQLLAGRSELLYLRFVLLLLGILLESGLHLPMHQSVLSVPIVVAYPLHHQTFQLLPGLVVLLRNRRPHLLLEMHVVGLLVQPEVLNAVGLGIGNEAGHRLGLHAEFVEDLLED